MTEGVCVLSVQMTFEGKCCYSYAFGTVSSMGGDCGTVCTEHTTTFFGGGTVPDVVYKMRDRYVQGTGLYTVCLRVLQIQCIRMPP